MANIMSLYDVTTHFCVTMDTAVENCFIVHLPDGNTIKFHPSETGLYPYELSDPSDIKTLWGGSMTAQHDTTDFCNVTTVKDQESLFTGDELRRAKAARRFQNITMRPNSCDQQDIAIPHLTNCPITRRDVSIADTVYGPNLGLIKGKREPPSVSRYVAPVPRDILSNHQCLSLSVDLFFINEIPFLLTYCQTLRFGAVDTIPNRQVPTIVGQLQATLRLYAHRGFTITSIYADPEFESLRSDFPFLDTCGADDHVGDIERYAASNA